MLFLKLQVMMVIDRILSEKFVFITLSLFYINRHETVTLILLLIYTSGAVVLQPFSKDML